MRNGYKYSLILHFILLLFCIINFPSFRNLRSEETIITLEPLPVSHKTNVQQEKKVNPQKKPSPRLKEVKPYKKPIESKDMVEADSKAVKPENIVAAKTKNVPRGTIAQTKEEPKLKSTPQAENQSIQKAVETSVEETPPTSEVQPSDKPENSQNIDKDFDSLFKDLAAQEEAEDLTLEGVEKGANKSQYNESLPLSLSEKDAIKSQIIRCWSIPAGGRDIKDMFVLVTADVDEDGTIKNIEIKERSSYSETNKKFYEVFVESTVRALQKCSPLQGLPLEKYGSWRKLELRFDPKELIF